MPMYLSPHVLWLVVYFPFLDRKQWRTKVLIDCFNRQGKTTRSLIPHLRNRSNMKQLLHFCTTSGSDIPGSRIYGKLEVVLIFFGCFSRGPLPGLISILSVEATLCTSLLVSQIIILLIAIGRFLNGAIPRSLVVSNNSKYKPSPLIRIWPKFVNE